MQVVKEILLSTSLLAIASVVTGFAEPLLSIQIIAQSNAPLEIVRIEPSGDNLFASVIVKNRTDRYVQDFDVAWSLFRPANCDVNSSATLQPIMAGSQSAYAEIPHERRPLPPGNKWGDRVLKPHEQTEITSLSLSRKDLLKKAKGFSSRKLRMQVGVYYVNFTDGDHFTSRNGPPDWHDSRFEGGSFPPDAEDAATQACKAAE
jgi:hypothetical protein